MTVSGKNFYNLLKANETVLLFPGGVRKHLRKNEKYQLFWPSKPEFVKMAIRFNAIIVPFAAIGAEDSFDIVMDAEDLLTNPISRKPALKCKWKKYQKRGSLILEKLKMT